jgi:hypothetical protein
MDCYIKNLKITFKIFQVLNLILDTLLLLNIFFKTKLKLNLNKLKNRNIIQLLGQYRTRTAAHKF